MCFDHTLSPPQLPPDLPSSLPTSCFLFFLSLSLKKVKPSETENKNKQKTSKTRNTKMKQPPLPSKPNKRKNGVCSILARYLPNMGLPPSRVDKPCSYAPQSCLEDAMKPDFL